MKISCNIQEVISFLIDKMNEGYKTVEAIDDARANGWLELNPTIEFIFNKDEHHVVGIDVRTKNKKEKTK